MSRFNTSNPLGSGSPLDLDDNAKNMDVAVNAEQDTFQDRLGKSRLTWTGIVKAGSGDPAIAVDAAVRAVDAADRAESAESSVEQNAGQIAQDAAEQAAQQAVDGVVIAVDGAVDRAEDAADRAEAAATAAQSASNTFDTTAQALLATADGQVFYLRTADPQVFDIWLNDDGVAVDQNSQFKVASAQDVAAVESSLEALKIDGVKAASEYTGNALTHEQESLEVLPWTTTEAQLSFSEVGGKRCLRMQTVSGGTICRTTWNVPRGAIMGNVYSASVVVEQANAGTLGRFYTIQRDVAGANLQQDIEQIHGAAESVDEPKQVSLPNVVLVADCAYISLTVDFNMATGQPRDAYIHSPFIAAGINPNFRPNRDAYVTPGGVADNSIDIRAAEFVRVGNQLFDKSKSTVGSTITVTTGELIPSSTADTSDFIRCEGGETYSAAPTVRWAQYDKNKNFIASRTSFPIHIYPNAKYFRVAGQGDTMMVNKGAVVLPYEPYLVHLSPEIRTVANEITERTGNLFDMSALYRGYSFDGAGGLVVNADYVAMMNYADVRGVAAIKATAGIDSGIVWYRKDRSVITRGTLTGGPEVAVPDDAEWFRISMRAVNSGGYMIRRAGDDLSFYEPAGVHTVDPIKYAQFKRPYLATPDFVSGLYRAGDSLPFNSFSFDSGQLAQTEALWQQLVDDNPEYITKEVIGPDESGDYEVWKLTLKSALPTIRTNKQRPKILLVVGQHGNEQACIYGTYLLVRDICERWRTDPLLRWLRWNCEIVIIPIANPWGMENQSRYNSNGVDLNRNYAYQHAASAINGLSPLSEIEAQYCVGLIADNADAAVLIDHHTNGYTAPGQQVWILLNGAEKQSPAQEMVARQTLLDATANYAINYGKDGSEIYGYVSYGQNPSLKSESTFSYGMPAYTYETTQGAGFLTAGSELIRASTENLGNFLLINLRALVQYGEF